MANPLRSKTLFVSIHCEARKVYDFVSDLANLPRWAKTFCRSIKRDGAWWTIETAQGPLKIRIAGKNKLGVLDHTVIPPGCGPVFVPMRVFPNGRGSLILFTIFQRSGMTDKNFSKDAKLVMKDLKTLKSVLEH